MIDFLRVEIKKMRSGTTLSLLGTFLDTIEFGGSAIKDNFLTLFRSARKC